MAELDSPPEHFADAPEQVAAALRLCHAVQVATPALAAWARNHNPNVAVFCDQLSRLPNTEASPRDSVNLLLVAHPSVTAWQPWIRTINEVLGSHRGRVTATVLGNPELLSALSVEAKDIATSAAHDDLGELLKDVDIAWLSAPTTPEGELCYERSFLECAAHGVCVLSGATPRSASVQHGETGLCYGDDQELGARLGELLDQPEPRTRLSTAARTYVARERMLSQHYRERPAQHFRWVQEIADLEAQARQRTERGRVQPLE